MSESAIVKKVAGASSSRRVLEMLLQFSESRPRATVAELAGLIDATMATTYRYVALLRELEVLEEAPHNRYQLTSRVMPLARAAQMVNTRATLALPLMEELVGKVRETVMLFERIGGAAICIQRVESNRPMRLTFELGHSIPLTAGASSRMILACLSTKARGEALAVFDDAERSRVALEIEEAKVRGYALSEGEVDEGVWACSVPVVTDSADPLVLTIAGPDNRLPNGRLEEYVSTATEYGQRIRAELTRFSLRDGDDVRPGPDSLA